jgi:hypothetical protein
MNEAAKCSERDRVSGSHSSAERLREKRAFHSDPLAGTHGRESKPRIRLAHDPSARRRSRYLCADWQSYVSATDITAYLGNGGTFEHAQSMAAHERPRTTKLYDRTKERLTQDEVERILL